MHLETRNTTECMQPNVAWIDGRKYRINEPGMPAKHTDELMELAIMRTTETVPGHLTGYRISGDPSDI